MALNRRTGVCFLVFFLHSPCDRRLVRRRERCNRYLLAFEHVAAMCLTLSTLRLLPELEELLVVEALEPLLGVALLDPDVLPVTATSCPTCLSSFDVSPES